MGGRLILKNPPKTEASYEHDRKVHRNFLATCDTLASKLPRPGRIEVSITGLRSVCLSGPNKSEIDTAQTTNAWTTIL